jgi:phosphate starvation-inducible PhoH-like protein
MSRRRNQPLDIRGTQVKELVDKVSKTQKPPAKPQGIGFKNNRQKEYYEAILSNTITIATGPAGTSKTFIAVYAACCMLAAGQIDKIIITKPTVETSKSVGALPGDLDEKMAPFIQSVYGNFYKIIGEAATHTLESKKQLEVLSLNFVRGLTLDNCIVIADEMQNANYDQTKALLTRIGENCKLVLNGDADQSDLKEGSGLLTTLDILDDELFDEDVDHIEFTVDDIVRSGIVKKLIIAYMDYEKTHRK